MPKYFEFKVCGYYLYFTAKCIVEAFHVHESDSKRTEEGAAKFFVREDGSTLIQKKGTLNDKEIRKIQDFIKDNYKDMYKTWAVLSENGLYKK